MRNAYILILALTMGLTVGCGETPANVSFDTESSDASGDDDDSGADAGNNGPQDTGDDDDSGQSQNNQNNDQDGDGFLAPDCDDTDDTIYPGAPEICGDGIDQDCDGEDLLCTDHELCVTVTYASPLPAIDFSYGYCEDQTDPEMCTSWHQSVSESIYTNDDPDSINDHITWCGQVSTGVMRFNASFFHNFSDVDTSDDTIVGEADAWLCQGGVLTAQVSITLDGQDMGDGDVSPVTFGSGCSAGLDVQHLVDAL